MPFRLLSPHIRPPHDSPSRQCVLELLGDRECMRHWRLLDRREAPLDPSERFEPASWRAMARTFLAFERRCFILASLAGSGWAFRFLALIGMGSWSNIYIKYTQVARPADIC